MKIKEPKDKYTLIGAVWRYYRHLFNNNCFTVWPDRIAEINKESITFFSLFGPLTVFLCAMHSADTFLLKLTSVLYTAFYLVYCQQIRSYMERGTTLFAYLVQLPAIIAGIALAVVVTPDLIGYSIMLMLAVFPFFIYDRPWRLSLYSVLIALTFTVVSFIRQPRQIALHEVEHTLLALLIGWTGQMFILNSRISSVEQGEYDPLTGIYNRRGAESQIESLLLAKTPGVLLMIDVDYFKSVNDSFGHEIGDRTLVEVARTLQRFFAANDIVMRFGGDEFIVFIKGEKERRRLAARLTDLCDQIDALDDFPDGNSVSISIGAAMYAGKGVVDYEYLRRQADGLLYQVKQSGRDGFKIG